MATIEELQAELDSLKAKDRAKDEQIAKFSKEKADLEAEKAEFEAKEAQRQKDEEKATFEREKAELETKLDDLVKSTHITPAQREKFMAEFRDEPNAMTKVRFAIEMAEAGTPGHGMDDGEQGKGESDEEGLAADEIILKRTRAYMAKNGEKNFSIAKRVVLQADDELAKSYRDQNGYK